MKARNPNYQATRKLPLLHLKLREIKNIFISLFQRIFKKWDPSIQTPHIILSFHEKINDNLFHFIQYIKNKQKSNICQTVQIYTPQIKTGKVSIQNSDLCLFSPTNMCAPLLFLTIGHVLATMPQFCFREYGRGSIKTGQFSVIKAELVITKI